VTDERRKLPSVNTLLEREVIQQLLSRLPRSLVVEGVRTAIDQATRSGTRPSLARSSEH
jgi:hypothetical protein